MLNNSVFVNKKYFQSISISPEVSKYYNTCSWFRSRISQTPSRISVVIVHTGVCQTRMDYNAVYFRCDISPCFTIR